MRRLLPLLLLGVLAAPANAQPAPNYVIFFQEWSAALDDAAQGVITQAATYAKAHPQSRIQITGYADITGGQRANLLVSELRAQMVEDQLTTDGISVGRIRLSAVGSIPSAMSKQQARRVTVSFLPTR